MSSAPREPASVSGTTSGPETPVGVRRYDFRTARKLSPAQRVKLGALHSRLVPQLVKRLSTLLRLEVEASFLGLEQVQVSSLTELSNLVNAEIRLNDGEGCLYLSWPRELAFFIIERVLGGSGEDLFLDKELSGFEQGIIRRYSDEAFAALRASFEKGKAPDGACEQVREDQEGFSELFPYEILLLAGMNLHLGSRQGKLTLIYPYNVIKRWLERSEPEAGGIRAEHAPLPARTNGAPDGLKQAVVNVQVRMTPTAIRFQDFTHLQVGDCVQLNHGTKEPFEIWIEGRRKYEGHLGQLGQQRGIKITGVCYPDAPHAGGSGASSEG